MNITLKEFEKQCWNDQTNHLDTEKFAELIIKECISDLSLHGYDDALIQIKHHFGVE